jgi:NodT family efflux transporter outer membrane factor (OMF) lipoprotein
MKKFALLSCALMLSSCLTTGGDKVAPPASPDNWHIEAATKYKTVKPELLKGWWEKFNDPMLNKLVELGLNDSPDILIAQARIAEARGLRRTSKSFLFPQISGSASAGREDTGQSTIDFPDNTFDAGFDASYELDVFGVNRHNLRAANEDIFSAEAQYHSTALALVAEITRNYIEYRAAQHQVRIAKKNLASQENTLQLIDDMHRLGAAPKLDVERTKNLVNSTRASIPEFQRQADGARLRMTVLVGQLPKELGETLNKDAGIPDANIAPVLLQPAEVLALRPDVKAAAHNLAAKTELTSSAEADIFPTFTLSGFYGILDNALLGSVTPWNIVLGSAVSLIDFGRIEGRIDAAEARQKQAFEEYRKTVLQAVSEVETALSDYAHINEQRLSLQKAYDSASAALEMSQELYKEGEIAFLDVLDSQRTVNDAEAQLVSAEAAQAASLVRLSKALGVY